MATRSLTLAAAVASGVLVGAGTAFAGAGQVFESVRVASGMNRPVGATHAPGDYKRLYIIEKRGVIRVLNLWTGELDDAPFMDIDARVTGGTSNNSEQGLLGIAFHPNYQQNGYFYVNYTGAGGTTHVARFSAISPDLADDGSEVTVLLVGQPESNHNGGWIGFGPNDGYLYIGMGDGGGANDQHGPVGNAQDITSNLLGKMLRVNVDGDDFPKDDNYAVPEDNPFVGEDGDDEIWSYGLRNPWRPSFDRDTGDLWIADVGQNVVEEVDFQPADSAGGENYGWRCMEGSRCTGLSGCTCDDDVLTDPIHEYTHGTGFSITGGYRYRGCDIPELNGTYFFADYVIQHVWTMDNPDDANVTEVTSTISPSRDGFTVATIASFGEDAWGEIYICDQGGDASGEVFKIVPVTPTREAEDINCDGIVGFGDLLLALSLWATPCDGCCADVDRDDDVDFDDVLQILSAWTP